MDVNSAFPSKYIKASDLKGRSIVVEIERVEMERMQQGGEKKLIVYFAGKDKGLVLNKTNAKKIASITSSWESDDWEGKQIVLYPAMVEFQGEEVEAVRVGDPKQAKKKEEKPAFVPTPPDDVDDSDIPFAWLLVALPALTAAGMMFV